MKDPYLLHVRERQKQSIILQIRGKNTNKNSNDPAVVRKPLSLVLAQMCRHVYSGTEAKGFVYQ